MKRPRSLVEPSDTMYGLFRSFQENNPTELIHVPHLPSSNFVHGSRRRRKTAVSGTALTSPYRTSRSECSSQNRLQRLDRAWSSDDYVLDLSAIAAAGPFNGPVLRNSDCFYQPNLNKFLALGRPAWKEARATLQKLLSSTEPTLRDNQSLKQESLIPLVAAVVGPGNELGNPVDVNEAADHIFGLVLMNGWIARDIQATQFIPSVPFLGKSFGTTISPWIVTLEALEPFSCDPPKKEPESYGNLLELTWDKPLSLNDVTRKFLVDGDEVIITGFSKGNGYKVGFGKCSGKIVPPP